MLILDNGYIDNYCVIPFTEYLKKFISQENMLFMGTLLKKPAAASHPIQSKIRSFSYDLTFTISLISPSTTLPLTYSVPRTTVLFAKYSPTS